MTPLRQNLGWHMSSHGSNNQIAEILATLKALSEDDWMEDEEEDE